MAANHKPSLVLPLLSSLAAAVARYEAWAVTTLDQNGKSTVTTLDENGNKEEGEELPNAAEFRNGRIGRAAHDLAANLADACEMKSPFNPFKATSRPKKATTTEQLLPVTDVTDAAGVTTTEGVTAAEGSVTDVTTALATALAAISGHEIAICASWAAEMMQAVVSKA